MGIIATTLGMICFTWAKSWRPKKRKEEGAGVVAVTDVAASGEVTSAVVVETAARDRKKHGEHGVRRWRALLCLGLAFVCLLLYMGLRGRCVVACDVKGWVAMQETIMRSEQIDRERMLGGSADNKTNEAKAEKGSGHGKEEAAAHDGEGHATMDGEGHAGEASNVAIPDFMDVERGEMYVPMWWLIPSEQKTYIEKEGALHDRDGLGYVLDTEMDTVVDWLRREWQPALMWTTVAFAALHLAIVGLVAGGVGFAFETADAVGELIASVFLGVRHGGEA
jgi:hypothetical protein